jgi:transposase
METVVDYKAKYEQAVVEVALLKQQMQQLQKMIFAAKHERFVPASHPDQLTLAINAEVTAQCNIADTKKISYTRTTTQLEKKPLVHPGRMKLPEHLERREVVIEPEDKTEGCRRIGEEITEELEYEPGTLYVKKFVRPKYVTADNQAIVIAAMIDRPLPKAIAGPGLLAQIVIDKYVDHLPLHRQQQRFSREQVNIPYSTITDWVSSTCALIKPLYDALLKEVMASEYLHADESPIKVLDKDKKGETHRGYYWVYHNSLQDLVLFDYRQGRGREGPLEMLGNFNGHLQTDGYAAYNIFDEKKDVTLLHCWAHARRKFYESQASDQARATYALEQIQQLYAIERRAKEEMLSREQTLQLRQQEAVPILQALHSWMRAAYINALPKSPIGKALAYSLERWDHLLIYTTDGKLNIDNNPVENSIRPVAIGRKNYLFAGSHEAAQRSAMLYSLMGTCKLHGINPFIWLRDTLEKIAQHPINKISELLPHNWNPLQ